MMSEKRKSERKFSRGSSSLGKRTRESQVEFVHSLATRGRRQGPTMTPGSGRGLSIGTLRLHVPPLAERRCV